ncbi:hypothetical protein PORCAN_86 [Porphyromonas crevioricanis JCM 13913]|nr:hypothetical protein PORCAN_86 [Porphyromonas crevioricanis JCM 13913]
MAGYSFNLDNGATLTIDRCRVDAKGVKGFSGFNQSSEAKLVIKNATVTAEGTEGSICDLSSLTLEGCKIDKPAGAVWNTSKHAVCDASGNIITSQVVIKPNTIGIERISPNEPGYRSIYSIEGVKIDIPFEQLPSGVYIVDGKKVLKM